MTRTGRRIFALLLALCLAAGPSLAADSEETPPQEPEADPDVVYTQEELLAWLDTHTEGTVRLGDSVTITSLNGVYAPVTIDTGPHSLIFDGGYLQPNGQGKDAVITGQGEDYPVVEVFDMGRMFIGNWSNYLSMLNITATGWEGAGGVALRIHTSGMGNLSFGNLQENMPGKIRSFGAGAVGIELTDPFDLFCFDVYAEGENSTAVTAESGANICFSKLTAQGDGARSVGGQGEIVMDTCLASPAPQGENITVYQAGFTPTWYPVKQGSDRAEFAAGMNGRFAMTALSGGSDASKRCPPFVIWDDRQYEEIDLSEPGRTIVRGTLFSDWLAEILSGPPEIAVDVRDPEIPCVYEVNPHSDVEGIFAFAFEFWMCDAWELDNCILWYSADGGESWSDITAEAQWEEHDIRTELEVTGRYGQAVVPVAMMEENVIFVVEATGYGQSNAAHFSAAFPNKLPDAGGDRIGTDRLGVDLSAEKQAGPKPDDPPENDTPVLPPIDPPEDDPPVDDPPEDNPPVIPPIDPPIDPPIVLPVNPPKVDDPPAPSVDDAVTEDSQHEPVEEKESIPTQPEDIEAPSDESQPPDSREEEEAAVALSDPPVPTSAAAVQGSPPIEPPPAVTDPPASTGPLTLEKVEPAKDDTPGTPTVGEEKLEAAAPSPVSATAPATQAPPPLSQPALPEPGFPVGAAVAVAGSAVVLAAGGWLWLKKPWSARK